MEIVYEIAPIPIHNVKLFCYILIRELASLVKELGESMMSKKKQLILVIPPPYARQ